MTNSIVNGEWDAYRLSVLFDGEMPGLKDGEPVVVIGAKEYDKLLSDLELYRNAQRGERPARRSQPVAA